MTKKIKIIDLLNMLVNNKYENMPKKIEYCDYTFEYTGLNYYSRVKDEYLERYIALEDLEQPVYILDEDEFEDITVWGKPALEELKTKDIKLRDLQSYIYLIALSQNDLIKNQKKIIERLNNEKGD